MNEKVMKMPIMQFSSVALILITVMTTCFGCSDSPSLMPQPVPSISPPPTNSSSPTLPSTDSTSAPEVLTLRQLAERKQIQIGCSLNTRCFSYTEWKEIVGREFNAAHVYWTLRWRDIETQRGHINFTQADEQVQFARSKNMVVFGHPLVFTSYGDRPDWLAGSPLSRSDLTTILRNHITQVMGHYKGQINTWVVLEDAYLKQYNDDDFLYDIFGYDYIDLVFQIARETDPSASLLYNDNDNHTSTGITTQLTHQIIKRLKAKRLIDGVGLEMHLNAMQPYTKQDVIDTMKSYGVPVYITEIDVNLANVQGTQEARYAKQATIYKEMLEASLESGVCKSFSVWGIGDKYSWLRDSSSIADPTLFDDNLKPKPAYFALRDVLK